MIWNPKDVLEKSYLTVEDEWSEWPIQDKQIQQAGIDIRLGKIFKVTAPIIRITENDKPAFGEIYRQLEPDSNGFIILEPGAYSVDTMEHIKVPEDKSAFVLHRSTFNRVGVLITGSVYDPGFEGNIGVTMYVHNRIEISIGVRIAQVLFVETSAASTYTGSYQMQQGHSE